MRAVGVAALVLVLSALSLLGVGLAVATMREPDPTVRSQPSADPPQSRSNTVDGCVIRLYPTGPKILRDRTHRCPQATAVHVRRDGALIVRRDDAEWIQSASVSPDETLVSRGIMAGASWARGRTTIKFYDTVANAPIRPDDPSLTGETANIWVTWVS